MRDRVPLPLALVGTGFNPRPARLSEHPEDDSLDVVPSGVSKVSEFDTIDTNRHDPHISPGEVSERVGAESECCR